jgi:hypothetical protein
MKEEVSQCICHVGAFRKTCFYATLREKLADSVERKKYETKNI